MTPDRLSAAFSASARVMNAFLKMKKFDLEQLKLAYEGQTV